MWFGCGEPQASVIKLKAGSPQSSSNLCTQVIAKKLRYLKKNTTMVNYKDKFGDLRLEKRGNFFLNP